MPDILMVDDDTEFSGLVSGHFTGLGYKVTLAQNGKEGLQKAKALKPDLIFLDVMMPDMNGIEVLRELRQAEETSDIPVLIMTGKYFDKGMIELFTQEGNCRDFLNKPVALSQLQQKAESLLKK